MGLSLKISMLHPTGALDEVDVHRRDQGSQKAKLLAPQKRFIVFVGTIPLF
ncbi:MAG: hypothetical protein KJ583_04550 [Nanoarchaeota archaeon]|nr:hypothetical protein [Nanoarchaeota archaeon]MBU1604562.1 hypothetical protein [Nanoarchaeota archaeon]